MDRLDKMPIRMPVDGTFELTVRCNLKCKMCLFRHNDSENKSIIMKEKTTKEWIDMAKQACNAGSLSLLITGGEPLIRPDFPEIYEAIYKMGFMITLYTNATMITDKIKDLLKKYPPHKIGITIYGSCPEVYKKVTGDGKAFVKFIEGIRFLKTLPSKLEVRTTIIKDNYDDIYNIENLVKNEIGENCTLVHSRIVYKPVRGGCGDVESCRLTPKENVRLYLRRRLDNITKIIDNNNNLDIDGIKFKFEKTESENEPNNVNGKLTLLGCSAGMDSYTIFWDGKLLACQLLGNFYTDPFDLGFEKAWSEFPFKVKLPEFNIKCKTCKNKSICNACYACRYTESGDLGGVPTYVCQDLDELSSLIKIKEK